MGVSGAPRQEPGRKQTPSDGGGGVSSENRGMGGCGLSQLVCPLAGWCVGAHACVQRGTLCTHEDRDS